MQFLHTSGHDPHRRLSAWQLASAAAVLVALSFLFPTACSAQFKPLRRLLILYESSPSSPLTKLVDQGIETALDNPPYLIEFHREYMETASFPNPADQQMFRDYYIRKYQNRRPDVVIAVGPTPLQFMLETHKRFFAGVPVIFCLPNRISGGSVTDSEFTGVESDIAPAQTLAAALRLQPKTMHVIVVSGTSPFDRQQNAAVKEQLKTYEGRLDISYLTDLAMPDLLDRLKHLPSHTVVILGALGRDTAGTRFTLAESGTMVVAAANAPVFILNDRALNHGEVGGDVSNSFEQGRIVGTMALRLFNGEKPKDVAAVKNETTYIFDWRALKRWGLKESDLPPGSIVINRPFSVWDAYAGYIVGGIALMLLETLLIFGLLWQRARRREANSALEKRTTALQTREELLKIFVKNVPAGVAMLDRDMRYIQVSDRWCTDYGVDVSQILGRSHYEALPDMPDSWRDIHRRALDGETLRADEDRWDRKSGTTWVRWEVRPWLNTDGTPGGILIFAEDITRRKQADEALSGMSRKLIESQEQERTRIGRELHDDINQQLALLAVDVDRLDQGGSTKYIHDRLLKIKKRVMEVATDVQAISHQLHSSKLEYLGLAAASKSLCREISELHNVRIDFTQNGVPRDLPQEVALCLFRVLQEALQNAVKYSGTDHFEVDLSGMSNNIWLKVRDFGRGFRISEVTSTAGVGLVSMRERVNLVKGEITIESGPMAGTEITVRVPAPTAERASEVTSGAA